MKEKSPVVPCLMLGVAIGVLCMIPFIQKCTKLYAPEEVTAECNPENGASYVYGSFTMYPFADLESQGCEYNREGDLTCKREVDVRCKVPKRDRRWDDRDLEKARKASRWVAGGPTPKDIAQRGNGGSVNVDAEYSQRKSQ